MKTRLLALVLTVAMMLGISACTVTDKDDDDSSAPDQTTSEISQQESENTTASTTEKEETEDDVTVTTTANETSTTEETTATAETTESGETTADTEEASTVEQTETTEETTTTEQTTTEEEVTTTEETSTVEETTTEEEAELTTEYPVYTGETAKVILIGGQSNAEGMAYSEFLEAFCGSEKYQEYVNGYSNVKMLIHTEPGSTTVRPIRSLVTNSLTNVKLGQGTDSTTFGPELGLAEYLAAHYPNETFYIIKFAIGGSVLDTEWYVGKNGNENGHYLRAFEKKVDNGLSYIETELGLKPEIVGFLWMQGESDGNDDRASRYYENQKALVEYIRNRYDYYAPNHGIAFVDAGISDARWNKTGDYYWPAYAKINAIKQRMANEASNNYYFDTISAGLSTYEDNNDYAHYGVKSALRLGNLFGETLSNAIDKYIPLNKPASMKPDFSAPTVESGPTLYVSGEDINNAITNLYEKHKVTPTLSADKSYVTLTMQDTGAWFYPVKFSDGARYLVIKYRTTKGYDLLVHGGSYREQAIGHEQFSDSIAAGDGSVWQFAFIDLEKSAVFKTYGPYISSLRITFQNSVAGDTVDIAFMAFYDTLEKAKADDRICDHKYGYDSNGHYMLACDICGASQGASAPHNSASVLSNNKWEHKCSVCGYADSQKTFAEGTVFYSADYINNARYNGAITKNGYAVDSDGTAYVRYTSNDTKLTYGECLPAWDGQPANLVPGTNKYLVFKMRTDKSYTDTMWFRIRHNNAGANFDQVLTNGSDNAPAIGLDINLVAGEWKTFVIDMTGFEDWDYKTMPNGKYPELTGVLIQLHLEEGQSSDIAYVAFCDSWASIDALVDETTVEFHNGTTQTTVNADGTAISAS